MLRGVFLVVLALGGGARAAALDDLTLHGYRIAAATRLPGAFTGCVRQRRLVFDDGSVFACARTVAQAAYEPRVFILRRDGDVPSVVLIGSRVQQGELLRLKLHDYPVPLRMNADPLAFHPARDPAALSPTGAIPSLNTVAAMDHAPLEQQQSRLPEPRQVYRRPR